MKGRNIRWWNRRGSATLEYVVILAAGAILALALTHALTSDEVKGSLQKKVMAALLGQETETPDAPFPGSTDPGGAPDGPAGGSTERPVSSAPGSVDDPGSTPDSPAGGTTEMPAPSNPDDGVNPDGGSTDKADDNENHPTPPAPPQEEEEGALEKIGKGTLDFLGYTDAKAAITGVDENGNKIGIGERILRGAMVLPIAKPVKVVKMVAKYGDDVLAAGKTKLDDVTRNWKKTACACPFSPHYKAAKEGGKHSGFYKQYVSKSDEQVKKGISSIQKQIEEHEDKIKNPTKYIPNFKELDPRQQQALLTKKWPSDIQRQKEQKTILEGILKERN